MDNVKKNDENVEENKPTNNGNYQQQGQALNKLNKRMETKL